MFKPRPGSPEITNLGPTWLGPEILDPQPEYAEYVDPAKPVEWQLPNGEYITDRYGERARYDVLCGAWADEGGNAWVVRKVHEGIDEAQPNAWLVLYFDAQAEGGAVTVTRRPVQIASSLRRDNHVHLHFWLAPQSGTSQLESVLQRNILDIYVNHMYQPREPGAVLHTGATHRTRYTNQLDGVAYANSSLPLFSEEELDRMGHRRHVSASTSVDIGHIATHSELAA